MFSKPTKKDWLGISIKIIVAVALRWIWAGYDLNLAAAQSLTPSSFYATFTKQAAQATDWQATIGWAIFLLTAVYWWYGSLPLIGPIVSAIGGYLGLGWQWAVGLLCLILTFRVIFWFFKPASKRDQED